MAAGLFGRRARAEAGVRVLGLAIAIAIAIAIAVATAAGGSQAREFRRDADPFYYAGARVRYYMPPARILTRPRGYFYAAPYSSFGRIEPYRPYRPYPASRTGSDGDSLKRKTAEQLRKAAPPSPPKGPLLIAISLANQEMTLYDDGVAIAQSPISTGTPSRPTPTGVFSVIQKARFHRSNLYSAAPMPFMQRITWSGVALHGGILPGYPASHGCIRLPNEFAIRLWGTTKLGARVIISNGALAPLPIEHSRLFTPKPKPAEVEAAVTPAPAPELRLAGLSSEEKPDGNVTDSVGLAVVETIGAQPAAFNASIAAAANDPSPATNARATPGAPISIFVSRKERRVFVRKGFEPLFDMPATVAKADQVMGTHVFTALALADGGSGVRWTVVSMPASERMIEHRAKQDIRVAGKARHRKTVIEAPVHDVRPPISASEALDRIELAPETVQRISALLSPGASLIISDEGLGPETGEGTGFVVLTR